MLAVDRSLKEHPAFNFYTVEGCIKIFRFVGKYLGANVEVKHKTINDSIFSIRLRFYMAL